MVTQTNARERRPNVRTVVARWVLTAELTLRTAAHIGGEESDDVDMAVLRDRVAGGPLLTGASLAGALRSSLTDRWQGYFAAETEDTIARLFGGRFGDETGEQSALIVFDSRGRLPEAGGIEVRDGLRIRPETGIADEGDSDGAAVNGRRGGMKYDYEVLPPGARFPLRLELLVPAVEREQELLMALLDALDGLDDGIRLGARGTRGLGAVRASNWRAHRYDLSSAAGWLEWLRSDHERPLPPGTPAMGRTALRGALLGPAATAGGASGEARDRRDRFTATLELRLPAGLLVRSPATDPTAPDAAHLRSGGEPVLPGASLAGVLRAQALRIARVVRAAQGDGDAWVSGLFGPPPGARELAASRLEVGEAAITGSRSLRPARTKIDRFTGGPVDQALYDEQPVYGGGVQLSLTIRQPRPGEAGLLLLVLKDLLTGLLPVGGAGAVGRGLLHGRAHLRFADGRTLLFDPETPLAPADADVVNAEVRAFAEAAIEEGAAP
jgi:CRISPR/Cas system CSM-associated protein Csm3 (group 7 of RAMP superfamily)